jgi:hypothetical protein
MSQTTRRATLLLVVVATAGLALLAPAGASGATPCWKRLINDWYDGRIDQPYPVQCYRQAIKNLPEDVKAYSSAREDIRRALLAAFRSNGPMGPSALIRPPGDRRSPGPRAGARGSDTRDTRGSDASQAVAGAEVSRRDEDGGPFDALFDLLAPGKADSVPLPLIVLAALAMLLLAAAAAGFVTRRIQARRVPVAPPSDIDPPSTFWPQHPPLRR